MEPPRTTGATPASGGAEPAKPADHKGRTHHGHAVTHVTGKRHRHTKPTIEPKDLNSRVRAQYDDLTNHLNSRVNVKAVQNEDGSITFRIKIPSEKKTPPAQAYPGALPTDLKKHLGAFLTEHERRIAATGMEEMRTVYGPPLPSARPIARDAKANAKQILKNWDDGTSAQKYAAISQTTLRAMVVFSPDGKYKEIHDPWSGQVDLAPGDIVVEFQKHARWSDLSSEDRQFAKPEILKKMPAQVHHALKELTENDKNPPWTVKDMKGVPAGMQAMAGLILDYLNLNAANEHLK